jgi:hypothetical protein
MKRKLVFSQVSQHTVLTQLKSSIQVEITEKHTLPKRVNLSYLSEPYHCTLNNMTTKFGKEIKMLRINRRRTRALPELKERGKMIDTWMKKMTTQMS